MLRINELRLPVDHTKEDLDLKIKKYIGKETGFSYKIVKRSLDSRKKPDLYYIYGIDIESEDEDRLLKRNKRLLKVQKKNYSFPYSFDRIDDDKRPIVCGFGPAGMFCALYLARAGLRPVVYERGYDVDKRKVSVDRFWESGELDRISNVQFGEGGAGTFSDGKLNTSVKEKNGMNHAVLSDLVRFGADEDILIDNKPHVGTDVLIKVVKNLRNEIISLGGEVHFESCVDGFGIEGGTLTSISVNGKKVPCDIFILAPGHSARDTFRLLKDSGLNIEPKGFAVGFRISHPAGIINEYAYGTPFHKKLGNASYKLTHICNDGRGVYSFCMCPGGYVVNASSEDGMIAVNGMSYSGRSSERSNSAVIVTVEPDDYMSGDDVLSGMYFQQELEKRAFEAGKGSIPVQYYTEYKNGVLNEIRDDKVFECIKGRSAHVSLDGILPEYIKKDIIKGIDAFDGIIPGFASDEAVLYAVESRTSSPIRMPRNELYVSSIGNLYVCGEGAGYAGGIMSAATDGIRVAENVAFALKAGS
ncbi:MAG: FAD-dependent oxidoreductase [Lachnospiraceae bacterium]|nr:FAD-dependent oxidoreductase [Lachnospiraceae bacterium]